MTAFGTINAREPVGRISAFQEALDDALFEQPLQPSLGSQFGHVAIGALVEGARTRVTRTINTASWRPSRRSRTWLAAS